MINILIGTVIINRPRRSAFRISWCYNQTCPDLQYAQTGKPEMEMRGPDMY